MYMELYWALLHNDSVITDFKFNWLSLMIWHSSCLNMNWHCIARKSEIMETIHTKHIASGKYQNFSLHRGHTLIEAIPQHKIFVMATFMHDFRRNICSKTFISEILAKNWVSGICMLLLGLTIFGAKYEQKLILK